MYTCHSINQNNIVFRIFNSLRITDRQTYINVYYIFYSNNIHLYYFFSGSIQTREKEVIEWNYERCDCERRHKMTIWYKVLGNCSNPVVIFTLILVKSHWRHLNKQSWYIIISYIYLARHCKSTPATISLLLIHDKFHFDTSRTRFNTKLMGECQTRTHTHRSLRESAAAVSFITVNIYIWYGLYLVNYFMLYINGETCVPFRRHDNIEIARERERERGRTKSTESTQQSNRKPHPRAECHHSPLSLFFSPHFTLSAFIHFHSDE